MEITTRTYCMPFLLLSPWWRHQMETFSALLALCAGNSPVTGEFPSQRAVKWSCDVFLDLRLNNRLREKGFHMDLSLKECHICNAICNCLDTWFPIWPPIYWYEMKLSIQIQERSSINCVLVGYGDKTYSNIFPAYMLLCIKFQSMVVFGIILSDNLPSDIE